MQTRLAFQLTFVMEYIAAVIASVFEQAYNRTIILKLPAQEVQWEAMCYTHRAWLSILVHVFIVV